MWLSGVRTMPLYSQVSQLHVPDYFRDKVFVIGCFVFQSPLFFFQNLDLYIVLFNPPFLNNSCEGNSLTVLSPANDVLFSCQDDIRDLPFIINGVHYIVVPNQNATLILKTPNPGNITTFDIDYYLFSQATLHKLVSLFLA